MVLHLARDCKFRRKKFRFYHCFGEEDGMKHLKRRLAIVLHVLMFMPFASVAVMFMHVCVDVRCTNVHARMSVCVCATCVVFFSARCGTCSTSKSEIPVDSLHDEAPVDQYERKNQNATRICLWSACFFGWHQS